MMLNGPYAPAGMTTETATDTHAAASAAGSIPPTLLFELFIARPHHELGF